MFEERRSKLGIPESLRSHPVLYVRVFRGVSDELARDRRIHWELSSDLVCKERELSKSCIIDLHTESLPEDFVGIGRDRLSQDIERRKKVLDDGLDIPKPYSGMGIQLVFMGGLDAEGSPIKTANKLDDKWRVIEPIKRKTDGKLRPSHIHGMLSNPAVAETYIHDGDDYRWSYMMRLISRNTGNAKNSDIVRQRWLNVLGL